MLRRGGRLGWEPVSGTPFRFPLTHHTEGERMDLGRARYRQAHKLPSQNGELLVLVLGIIVIIAVVVASWPN